MSLSSLLNFKLLHVLCRPHDHKNCHTKDDGADAAAGCRRHHFPIVICASKLCDHGCFQRKDGYQSRRQADCLCRREDRTSMSAEFYHIDYSNDHRVKRIRRHCVDQYSWIDIPTILAYHENHHSGQRHIHNQQPDPAQAITAQFLFCSDAAPAPEQKNAQHGQQNIVDRQRNNLWRFFQPLREKAVTRDEAR